MGTGDSSRNEKTSGKIPVLNKQLVSLYPESHIPDWSGLPDSFCIHPLAKGARGPYLFPGRPIPDDKPMGQHDKYHNRKVYRWCYEESKSYRSQRGQLGYQIDRTSFEYQLLECLNTYSFNFLVNFQSISLSDSREKAPPAL